MSRYADVPALVTVSVDPVPPTDEGSPSRSTWAPVDLGDALDGADVPAPCQLKRSDGVALLYAGRTHSFSGEPESCKTWAALLAVAQVLEQGGRSLWIDYEDDDRGVVSRLLALGVERDAIRERFTYVRPEEPLQTRDGRATTAELDLVDVLAAGPHELVVIDGVTEGMTTEGLDLMSNADVATFMRRLPKRFAATGAATVMLDHLAKNRENQGRYAIGGQHKLAGLTGAAYKFEVRRPLARAQSDPVEAVVAITVNKDRPGYVRGRSRDGAVGTLELTAWPDGAVSGAIVPPGEGKGPDLSLVVTIGEYLDTYPGATQRKIEENVAGKTDAIRAALRWMASPERQWLAVAKVGQGHQHTLTELGRQEVLP